MDEEDRIRPVVGGQVRSVEVSTLEIDVAQISIFEVGTQKDGIA